MIRLTDNFKPGDPTGKVSHDWYNTAGRWLNGFAIAGYEIQWTQNGIKCFPSNGGGARFSGTAYIAGNKTTGLGTKAWVRCFLDTATAVDADGPPPNPFPPNEEWYEVAQTPGDIHITRA